MKGKSTDSALARDILEWNVPEECVLEKPEMFQLTEQAGES
jgi:hypothetical protein